MGVQFGNEPTILLKCKIGVKFGNDPTGSLNQKS